MPGTSAEIFSHTGMMVSPDVPKKSREKNNTPVSLDDPTKIQSSRLSSDIGITLGSLGRKEVIVGESGMTTEQKIAEARNILLEAKRKKADKGKKEKTGLWTRFKSGLRESVEMMKDVKDEIHIHLHSKPKQPEVRRKKMVKRLLVPAAVLGSIAIISAACGPADQVPVSPGTDIGTDQAVVTATVANIRIPQEIQKELELVKSRYELGYYDKNKEEFSQEMTKIADYLSSRAEDIKTSPQAWEYYHAAFGELFDAFLQGGDISALLSMTGVSHDTPIYNLLDFNKTVFKNASGLSATDQARLRLYGALDFIKSGAGVPSPTPARSVTPDLRPVTRTPIARPPSPSPTPSFVPTRVMDSTYNARIANPTNTAVAKTRSAIQNQIRKTPQAR